MYSEQHTKAGQNIQPLTQDSTLELVKCYKVIQRFRVTGLYAGQHNTKLHGTITDVIYKYTTFDKVEVN